MQTTYFNNVEITIDKINITKNMTLNLLYALLKFFAKQ